MLENTSKHHFGSNGDYWVCWCENVRRNFGTPKHSLIVPKRTSFSSFCMHSGSQMLENTPNINLGLMEVIACARSKTVVGNSVPQNRTTVYQQGRSSDRFACILVTKCSKTL